MKTKDIPIRNINTVEKYLQIFSGIFKLTDTEMKVLSEMIRYQLKGIISKTAADPFSSSAKKTIASNLGMGNPYSINTYVQRFRDKKAIIPRTGGGYQIHPWLIPKGEKQIIITPEWKLKI